MLKVAFSVLQRFKQTNKQEKEKRNKTAKEMRTHRLNNDLGDLSPPLRTKDSASWK